VGEQAGEHLQLLEMVDQEVDRGPTVRKTEVLVLVHQVKATLVQLVVLVQKQVLAEVALALLVATLMAAIFAVQVELGYLVL
tara:strand:- start:54 stop:299 length:246 start_codon:yes stop_codon:yes gene_type:complete